MENIHNNNHPQTSPLLINIGKCSAIIYALFTSPIAGLAFLGYMLWKDEQIKILQRQLNAALQEEEENTIKSISIDNLEKIQIQGNITNFDIYKRCVIENYQNKFYRIQTPSREYVPKIFLTQDDAKKEIDIVEPFLKQPEVRERRRVYNIRYVK